jgi:hypothetical protein
MTPNELQQAIQKNPIKAFWDHCLNSSHWSKQREIMEALFKKRRVTVKGCHGFGKSYTAARAGLSFLYAFKDSIVITTAPTFRQVETIIWREWRGAHARATIPLGGRLLKTSHEMSENWYAMGISSDKTDAFQGIHSVSGKILVIVDEAAGMPPEILQVVEAMLTSEDAYLLYIGNPTRGDGQFYESFKNPFFHKISVDVFCTPNFTKNNIKSVKDLKNFKERGDVFALPLDYPQLVTPIWAWERMHDWGEDSPMFQSRVCAQFPVESSDTLIPLHHVEQALAKTFSIEDQGLWTFPRTIGIDVARFGDDKTVLTAARCTSNGDVEHIATEWLSKKDTMQVVGYAIALFNEMGFNKKQDSFVVDDTGVGGGVTDRLNELGYNVIQINFANSSSDDRFVNIKAEMMWNLKTLFKDQRIKIIDKGALCGQLPIVKYDYTSQSKIFIVSKKDMKKKGLESPDFVDSLALACFGFADSTNSGYIYDDQVKDDDNNTFGGNLYNKVF